MTKQERTRTVLELPAAAVKAYADCMLDGEFKVSGEMYRQRGEYVVTVRLFPGDAEVTRHPNSRVNVILPVIQWASMKHLDNVQFTYEDKPYATITAVFQVPTPEERYFHKYTRKAFLHSYAVYQVAMAIRKACELQGLVSAKALDIKFPNPRHPNDLKAELLRGELRRRVRHFFARLRGKRDKYSHYD